MPIEPMGPVVVGVDGSSASLAALDLAAGEATARVSPLVVVHARVGDETAAAAARLAAVALSRARSEHPSIAATAVVGDGDPVTLLLARSRGGSLLVVGHNGHCVNGRVRHESIAHRMVGPATTPVIVHRRLAPSGTEERPVLAAVAGAPGDDAVLAFAFAEAAVRGVPLLALTVWPGTARGDRDPSRLGFAQRRGDADHALDDELRPWSEKYPQVTVRRAVRHGLDVAMAVTATSRSAQLVVVGMSARPGGRSMLSLAQILTHRAGCPVAVVPTR